jgi:DNA (cytosine-5)-methyltransferase 1
MKIRVFEAFAGYGSQCLALKRLKRDYPSFDFEVVGISEIDKYAIRAYEALHGEANNYGDISKIDWSNVPDFDLFTYSFPCTDISTAGQQQGFDEGSGTRSSLLWECRKAIVQKRPKYLLMENVKAICSKKFMPLFQKWLQSLEDYGYYTNWAVLNAKDYGVPQNRERCFAISIRRDLLDPSPVYHFPEPLPLKFSLKDVFGEALNPVIIDDTFGYGPENRVYREYSPTIRSGRSGLKVTLVSDAEQDGDISYFIRKITPREYLRLMDVDDKDIDKIQNINISNTRQHKLAGNSIVVNVLYHIFLSLFACSLKK